MNPPPNSPNPVPLDSAAASTIGLIRAGNEDRLLADPVLGWFAVADGIGGLGHGEYASECAITVTRQHAPHSTALDIPKIMAACQESVCCLGRTLGNYGGIGTTLTVAHVSAGQGCIGQVGDSAAFLHRSDQKCIERLTSAHAESPPLVKVDGAPVSEFQPNSVLNRYVGQSAPLSFEVQHFTWAPGDRLILCTDGITSCIDRVELAAMSQAQSNPRDLAKGLLRVAEIRGGVDNATCVIVDLLTSSASSFPLSDVQL